MKTVYNDREEIPLRTWRAAGIATPRGWNTLVTPRDVERASELRSDQIDGAGILAEIDTAWGLIPEGGALDYSGFGSD